MTKVMKVICKFLPIGSSVSDNHLNKFLHLGPFQKAESILLKLGLKVYGCNPRTGETGVEGWEVNCCPWLLSEVKASVGYVRHCLTLKNIRRKKR